MWKIHLMLSCLLYLPNTGAVNDIYGMKGKSVMFVCPFKRNITQELRWTSFRNSTLTVLTINDQINPYIEPGQTTRLSVVGNHSIGEYNLQISDIRESDEGIYRCNVGIQQDVQTLYLIVPPSSVSIENVTTTNRVLGTEGDYLTVSCLAVEGKPPPNVAMKCDGTTLATGIQSVTYKFLSINRSYDHKTVLCEASNEANVNNPENDSAVLYLSLKPLQPTFSTESVSTEETRPLVVSCTSTGSRPAASFKWMIGLATITSGITTVPVYNTADDIYTVTSTLTYTVDRIHNGQTVTCGAYNNVSISGVMTSKYLDVKFAPDIYVNNITYNQNMFNITVTCFPAGNPSTYTYYRWQHRSKYGELIRELDGGQILTLPSVSVEARYQDNGEYVCTASNGITGRDGKIQQTGSGYVTVNAQPVFTSGNKDTEFEQLGKDVYIHVYVFNVPKYISVRWYKINNQISGSSKYSVFESASIVTDTLHNKEVNLDGYSLTLTIKNLVESDFNVSYIVELYNGVGQTVVHTTLLLLASPPQTPLCFSVPSSLESSVLVQWEPADNGGYEQIFYLEYREFGSYTWILVKIPDTKQKGRQTFTLNGLRDATLYELMMYAENKFNKSLPTETLTVKTIKDCKLSSLEEVIGGVSGGLSAVIVILIIIIIVLLMFRKHETRKHRSKEVTPRRRDKISYNNPIDSKENDDQEDTRDDRNIRIIVCGDKLKSSSTQEYETIGMNETPNTYTELLPNKDELKTRPLNRHVSQHWVLRKATDADNVRNASPTDANCSSTACNTITRAEPGHFQQYPGPNEMLCAKRKKMTNRSPSTRPTLYRITKKVASPPPTTFCLPMILPSRNSWSTENISTIGKDTNYASASQ